MSNKEKAHGEPMVDQPQPLTDQEKRDIEARIQILTQELNNTMYYNGQSLNEGDGATADCSPIIEERAALYHRLGKLSPEEIGQEKSRLTRIVVARTLMHQARSGGYGWSGSENEE